jgi:hypothetical protein
MASHPKAEELYQETCPTEQAFNTDSNRFCGECRKALGVSYETHLFNRIEGNHHETLENFRAAVTNGCPLCVFAFTHLDTHILKSKTWDFFSQCPSFKIIGKIDHTQFTMSFCWIRWPLIPEQPEIEQIVNIPFDLCALKTPPALPPLIPGLDLTCTGSIDLRPWLSSCIKSHSCGIEFRLEYLPPRLLDCRGTNPRLIDGCEVLDTGDGRRYAALSHCWGQSPTHILLTTDNIATLHNGIGFSELPPTFQDAIRVVRRAGVHYLWIDSLCIIQQGPRHLSDWQQHIKEMADIYSNCYFNIAATHSKNSEGGCFVTRPPEFPGLSLLQSSRLNVPRLIGIVAGDYSNAAKMNLNSRAWVYQERLLSPRVVYYTENDVLWECQESYLSGSFYHKSPDLDYNYRGGRTLLAKTNIGSVWYPPFHWHGYDTFNNQSRIEREKDNKRFWFCSVEWYSHLAITHPDDRLPAIAAIARRLNERYFSNDAYIAGFFKSDLPRALCFTRFTSQERSETYVSPTWSWSALQGHVRFDMVNDYSRKMKPTAKVKSVSVDLVDPTNAYGQLKSASLTLKAPISRMTFDPSLWDIDVLWGSGETGAQHLILNPQGRKTLKLPSDAIFRFAWDDDRQVKPAEVFILHIFKGYGLVLEQKPEKNGKLSVFVRVGSWSDKSKLFHWDGEETVVLV